jgi:hypothetical protein
MICKQNIDYDRQAIESELIDYIERAIAFLGDCDEYIEIRLQLLDGKHTFYCGDSQYDTDHRGYWGMFEVEFNASDSEIRTYAQQIVTDAYETFHIYGR